jgi:hypothetical protein
VRTVVVRAVSVERAKANSPRDVAIAAEPVTVSR